MFPIMLILSAISAALSIFNQIPSLVTDAEKAFDGKPGSGTRKKKFALSKTKLLLDQTEMPAAEKKLLLKEASKSIDNIVKTAKMVNKLKK